MMHYRHLLAVKVISTVTFRSLNTIYVVLSSHLLLRYLCRYLQYAEQVQYAVNIQLLWGLLKSIYLH